jgi:hypothetical protein
MSLTAYSMAASATSTLTCGTTAAEASSRRTLTWAVGLLGDTKVLIQPMSMATWKPSKLT